MAQVLELFGPPGAGKSALMRALDGRRIGSRSLIAAHRLARGPRRWPLGLLLSRDLAPAERRRALAARRSDWSELLDLIATAPLGRGPGEASDPLRALHAPGWLAATLELRALADAAPDDVIVVLDEGLVQRAPIVCGPDPSETSLRTYLRALPVPRLHVHLELDRALLLSRLRARGRVIDRHAELDDEMLSASVAADADLFARCTRILAESGLPVLTVTSDGDPAATATRVIAALGGPTSS
jgi:hypothetical protein